MQTPAIKNSALYFILCLLIVSLTYSTSSAYYQYTDANGTVNFVESPEMVPQRHRSKAVKKDNKNVQSANQPTQVNNAPPATAQEPDVKKVQDVPKNSTNWLRWNFGFLILLIILRFIIAKRMEQLKKPDHAIFFRRATLLLLIGVAFYFNKDIVYGGADAISFKVTAIQQKMAEQREKDRKPLKTLSEKMLETVPLPKEIEIEKIKK